MAIFCRRIIINKPVLLKKKGPLLLACNHPNSFLDAAIVADLFHHPVYSLARGDVFTSPFYIKLLRSLNILPVYRTSEGVANLNINYHTFNACREIFKQDGIVLIFSEGRCINEWHLRPLKKGTARLAFSAWNENIPLEVLPVGINYSSFRRFSKNMIINFGSIIKKEDFDMNEPDGKKNQSFNNQLREELSRLVFEIDKTDIEKQKLLLEKKPSLSEKILLFIPAIFGWLFHSVLYLPIKKYTIKRTKNNDHFDSIVIALLIFTYPLYLVMIITLMILFTKSWMPLFLFLLLPFTAWAYTRIKHQLDKPSAR